MHRFLAILLAAVLTAGSAGAAGPVAAAPPPGAVAQDLPELGDRPNKRGFCVR